MIQASVIGFALILIGLWAMLSRKNIIKIIIGFSIMDTGVHLTIISLGYIKGRTAPIIDSPELKQKAASLVVDPVPSALVLTAIVIGLAVTALMLVYAVKLYKQKHSLSIEDYKDLKW